MCSNDPLRNKSPHAFHLAPFWGARPISGKTTSVGGSGRASWCRTSSSSRPDPLRKMGDLLGHLCGCHGMYIHIHVDVHVHVQLHCVTLHLHHMTAYYITLHYITLNFITCHYITVHWIHYIYVTYITYAYIYIYVCIYIYTYWFKSCI